MAGATYVFGGPTISPAYKIAVPPVIDGTIHEDSEWKGVPSVSGLVDGYGRLTKQGNNLNGYLAYRLSGNLGAEYYLILGDPNALTFHTSLILKVAIPFVLGGRLKP